MSLSGSGDECTKAAEESTLSQPKEQPESERHSNSEGKDFKTPEVTASSEPEHQEDGDNDRRQTIEATSLSPEESMKS